MSNFSPEVDRYIANAAPFARPILEKIRKAFHAASPEIEEVMKWGMPHFQHKGIVGSMAAFKQHVNWCLWKAKLMKDPKGILTGSAGESAMGIVRLTEETQGPSEKVLLEYVREAIRLNDEGVKIARPAKKSPAPPPELPADLVAELKKNTEARKTFDSFPPSHQREYITWIVEAKQEATRKKRLATTLEWLAEGKPRNWKYMENKS